jgi:hypothetical protein
MNSKEELIILGSTSSADFPTTLNAFDRSFNGGTPVGGIVVPYQRGSDIIIARVNREGTKLLSSTFLGGGSNDGLNPLYGELEKNYGDQLRGDVVTDKDDNIYISSVTASDDFPQLSGLDDSFNGGSTDALVAKLSSDLTGLIWSTYIGGIGADASMSIKFDKTGGIFIAGGPVRIFRSRVTAR